MDNAQSLKPVAECQYNFLSLTTKEKLEIFKMTQKPSLIDIGDVMAECEYNINVHAFTVYSPLCKNKNVCVYVC